MSGNRRMTRRRVGAIGVMMAAIAISATMIIAKDGEKKAEYLGAETCVGCHDGYNKKFMNTKHRALFMSLSEKGPKAGCEACHSAGGEHVGDPEKGVIHFSKAAPAEANKACLKCHDNGDKKNWKITTHAQEGLTCAQCHKVHGSKEESKLDKSKNNAPHLLADNQPDLCISCHKERAGDMNMAKHHPLKEGKVNCSDCHSPHDTSAAAMESSKTACVKCHAEKAGPFNYEHEPVTEGCTTCHQPHGSPNKALLSMRVPGLCLQCHTPAVNAPNHDLTNAAIKKCGDCHAYTHGSNSSETFQSK